MIVLKRLLILFFKRLLFMFDRHLLFKPVIKQLLLMFMFKRIWLCFLPNIIIYICILLIHDVVLLQYLLKLTDIYIDYFYSHSCVSLSAERCMLYVINMLICVIFTLQIYFQQTNRYFSNCSVCKIISFSSFNGMLSFLYIVTL